MANDAVPSDVLALHAAILAKQEAVTVQGDTVKALKTAVKQGTAQKDEVDAAIKKLQELKLELDVATKEYSSKMGNKDSSIDRMQFRKDVTDALERRMFIIPSFKIYNGVAGLFDYGPPGCSVKQNVLSFWRQHYVLAENMLEVDCPCVTPEVVLRASGHVEKFTDLMVKDEKTGTCYRADHLLKDHIGEVLEKNPLLEPAKIEELKHILATLDEFTAAELGEKMKFFGIKAPDTGNDLSDPYPFNLMFGTQIGPTGMLQGFLRPETAQGIFVNFRDLLYYNGGKLPFAAAQIGQAFRNEIAPRAGLLRVREFTLAEIEHFVNPDDKSHPKFASIADLEFLLYPRAEQLGPKKTVAMRIGDAVKNGIVNNETLGYYIGRTYLFLTKLGINPKRLRFRQHLPHEMAHYAADCWDAEIENSYGWTECVGLADRSAFDLKAHTDKSKIELVAYEKFKEPREVEELKVAPNKQKLGKELKKDGKIVAEYLEAMEEGEALAMKAKLDAGESVPITVCTTGQQFTITKDMVSIEKKTVRKEGQSYTPSVIEPSFGIGRIIYCLFEHSFGPSTKVKDGEEPQKPGSMERTVFKFTPLVAPIKCTVFPLVQDKQLNSLAAEIATSLTAAGLSNKIDTTGTTIGKRYARTDELGVPFAVTVDFQSKDDGTVTLRDRDSPLGEDQVRIKKDEVTSVVRKLTDSLITWRDVQSTYPAHVAKDLE
eukprot:TRINITY_DN1650_c0_g2_i1.p1 TRINITY_DN1650_c0_g2~~TRINITY_DN1650_c0_g2_i1.p1  ORF type:complete len:741 (-),score=194.86 TRINITY_DN1650_c0_g2_i1:147-2285(-)